MIISLALIGLITGFVCLQSTVQVLSGIVEDKYSCPHGWTRYGGKKCLKYVNELQDYERAQATCRSKNQGTLVTVHSQEEQNFVYSYIHSIAASSTPIWLGAKQIDFESILWLDKTENSYTNWAPSEPSHPDEICIAINPRNGLWHDVMCTENNVPACERAPTTQWPFFVAFCSEGWFQFNDEKCVRIISSQALNFYESQELCRSKYNSKLLSIKTDKESEFVHNLIKFRDVKLPVWLGAVQNDFSSFNWIDKSDVTFTNWAESEPNDPDHACISMMASGGKWSDNDCKEQRLILCQKVPEEGSCETGWLQFRQDKCYRFVHIRLAFDDAESLCSNLYGGHLPSIHSQEEQFMISQFLTSVNVKNGSEIWLGGRQMDFHNFNWGDGSMFNYSYWDQGEPSFPTEKCIEMSWRNGRWNDINCRLKRAVLCERQVTSRHLQKPILYQIPTGIESNCSSSSSSSGSSLKSISQQQPAGDSSTSDSNNLCAPTNETLNSNSNNNNNNNSNSPTEPLDSMVPSDDKPIKVITSIINREHIHQQPQQQFATTNSLLPSSNNSLASSTPIQNLTMTARRELPLPDAPVVPVVIKQELQQLPSTLAAAQENHQASPPMIGDGTGSSYGSGNSAQVQQETTASLLDKLKPNLSPAAALVPTSISTTSQPGAALSSASNTNTTALETPTPLVNSSSPAIADSVAYNSSAHQLEVPVSVSSSSAQQHTTVESQAEPAAQAELFSPSSPSTSSSSSSLNNGGGAMAISGSNPTAQEFAQVTSLATPSGQMRERINPNDGQSFNHELRATH